MASGTINGRDAQSLALPEVPQGFFSYAWQSIKDGTFLQNAATGTIPESQYAEYAGTTQGYKTLFPGAAWLPYVEVAAVVLLGMFLLWAVIELVKG